MNAQAADSITRIVTVDGNPNTVTIDANSQNKLVDYATLRARAAYAFSQFLPYAFVGGAVGRFNYAVNATVTDVVSIAGVPQPPVVCAGSSAKDNAIVGGFTLGLGLDVAILPNVFLRAEWEYVGFAQANGIRSTMNTGRVGLGVTF
jgi:opacity protein-like surface antigen